MSIRTPGRCLFSIVTSLEDELALCSIVLIIKIIMRFPSVKTQRGVFKSHFE